MGDLVGRYTKGLRGQLLDRKTKNYLPWPSLVQEGRYTVEVGHNGGGIPVISFC